MEFLEIVSTCFKLWIELKKSLLEALKCQQWQETFVHALKFIEKIINCSQLIVYICRINWLKRLFWMESHFVAQIHYIIEFNVITIKQFSNYWQQFQFRDFLFSIISCKINHILIFVTTIKTIEPVILLQSPIETLLVIIQIIFLEIKGGADKEQENPEFKKYHSYFIIIFGGLWMN